MFKFLFRTLPVLLLLAGLAVSCELLEGVDPGGGGNTGKAASLEARKSITSNGGYIFVEVTASGDWTITLTFPEGTAAWATMDPASGSGSKGDVRMRYDANTSTAPRSVVMDLIVGEKTAASLTIEQLGEGQSELSAGGFKSDTAPVKWLELPETKAGDGCYFYAHDMVGGGYIDKKTSGTRNWSFYWCKKEFLSIWVAYPLNKNLIGSGSRSDEWGIDPLIPANEQPRLISGSYGGGWTRGHQIPSADRLNHDANVSTFYGTNMTPQNYDFNCEIWARLEEKVRKYASTSDTLYVVTGCVLEGSTQKTGGSSGFIVKVPAAYFKALLYLSPNRKQYHKGYMAAGYYMPHNTSIIYDPLSDYLMSIDELESKTGIDFFVNLPAAVGSSVAAEIEAETPVSWWK